MLQEAQFSGILFAPVVVYSIVGIVAFLPLRYLLGRVGFLKWIWHAALFELSLYICVASAVILVFS